MSILHILGIIIISAIVGGIIGYFIGNKKSPTGTRSALSDSLAKMIYSSVDTTKEAFDSSGSAQDKDIEEISILISKGNIKEIEDLIKKDTTLDIVTKKINTSSEVLKPDLVKDDEIKDAVDTIKLEGEINKIQDKIAIATLTLETVRTNATSTEQEKQKALQILNELSAKLAELQRKLSVKAPLETALSKVTDPEKLAHLQEIQAKILSKREEVKKIQEEQVKKENPKVKEELERKIKEEKNKDVEEKKTKIKENRDREKDRSANRRM